VKRVALSDAAHEEALRELMSGRELNPGSITNGESIAAVLRRLDAAREALASIPADIREACGVTL